MLRSNVVRAGLAVALSTSSAFAQERPIIALNPKVIPNAVSMYITTKGERSISRNFESMLAMNGFSIREGYFPAIEHKSATPIPLESIAKGNPKAGESIKTVRAMLGEWFVGLSIRDPQPNVLIKGAGYKLSLKSLNLEADRGALAKLGRKTGVVVALEAEIDAFDIGAESITATDPKNAYLGKIGVLQPVLSLVPGQQTLRLRVPMYLDVTNSGVKFEILEIDTNLGGATFALQNGPLIVPDVAIVVNGEKFPLDKNRLVKAFEDMKPQLVTQIKEALDLSLQQSFLKMANAELAKKMPLKLGQVARMKPAGGVDGDPRLRPDFVWGMVVKKLGMGKDVIAIEMDSYVEDPLKTEVPLIKGNGHRGPVTLAGANPQNFDLAIAISRGLVNRVVQLSARRGFFADVESKPGEKTKMLAAPTLDIYKPTAGKDSPNAKLTIKVSLASPVKGILQKIMIKKEVKFTVDVIGQFIKSTTGRGMQIQLMDFDYSTLYVWPESLTGVGRLFRNKVLNGVKDELRKSAAGWKTKPNVMQGELPLPPELFGQKLAMRTMRMDRNGYIVMFLDLEGAQP